MYDIYLYDPDVIPQYTTIYTPILESGGNVTNPSIIQILGAPAGIPVQAGDYVKYISKYYQILSYSYDSTDPGIYSFVIVGSAPVGAIISLEWGIYRLDYANYTKLDTEDIQLSTVFSVASISDISARKDAVTKSISLKGTKRNNEAFGRLFLLNRYVDSSNQHKLFAQYSPLRTVDCLVYEDSILILRGVMYVTDITVANSGAITYNATITGKFVGLKAALGDSLISDLDLTDLQHTYDTDNISGSQGPFTDPSTGVSFQGVLEKYNPTTDSYYTEFFQLGKNYIYIFIDYSETFINPNLNLSFENIKLQNWRPAVWAKEILNRIFASTGYTYEIKGSSDFVTRFNSLLIPNGDEKFEVNSKTQRAVITKTSTQVPTYNRGFDLTNRLAAFPVKWDSISNDYLLSFSSVPYGDGTPDSNRLQNLLNVNRNFTSDARVSVSGTFFGNSGAGTTDTFSVQFCKRNYTNSTIIDLNFEVLGEQKFTVAHGETLAFTADFLIPETDFTATSQLQVRVLANVFGPPPGGYFYGTPTITSAQLDISKDANTTYRVAISPGDIVNPSLPPIKSFDFLKGIINMYNFYVYNTNENPNHLIFETYDDFYALTSPVLIKSNALDWSKKIDYSKGIKINSNLSIPKSYTFTYGDDSDYLNKGYKLKFGENYGTLTFSDSLGISNNKTVQLPFAASPIVEIGGTNRFYPIFSSADLSNVNKKPIKTNCRILYYNGLHACNNYSASVDKFENGAWTFEQVFSSNWYCNASMYYYDPVSRNGNTPYESDGVTPKKMVPIASLNFNTPKEFYFNADSTYLSAPNIYNNYYINQVTELTDLNLFTVQMEVRLTELDISNLDLSIPVYIDTGKYGAGYFKILELEYQNNQTTTTVTLQKIHI